MIIRGVRGVTDFEYEYQLTGMNRRSTTASRRCS